jgi:SAM-dependent methyltransferase
MVRGSAIVNINKFFKKSTSIEKVFYLSIVMIIIFAIPWAASRHEGFKSRKEFVIRRGSDIFDDFYVDVYDSLLYDEFRNNYEIGRLVEETKITKKSVIADIGCATGHTVGSLANFGYNVKGIDFSKSLIKKAKENYPEALFEVADIRKALTFEPSSLSHITCFYFTIYMIQHKRRFFENCIQWLMPGGYLVLHLVDRNNFDPILPVGNVFTGVDPQNYAEKRITSTVASFENHDYTAKFNIKGDDAYLVESFKSKNDGSIRKNEHHMYMPTQERILAMARDAGFIIISKSDMKSCQHDNQFIYVLQKPF